MNYNSKNIVIFVVKYLLKQEINSNDKNRQADF